MDASSETASRTEDNEAAPTLSGAARLVLSLAVAPILLIGLLLIWHLLPCTAGIVYDHLGVSGAWSLAAGLWAVTLTLGICSRVSVGAPALARTAYAAIALTCAALILHASDRAGCSFSSTSPVLYWRGVRAALTVPTLLVLLSALVLLIGLPTLRRSPTVWIAIIFMLLAVNRLLGP